MTPKRRRVQKKLSVLSLDLTPWTQTLTVSESSAITTAATADPANSLANRATQTAAATQWLKMTKMLSGYPCPACSAPTSKVVDTRRHADGSLHRARQCFKCLHKFRTAETQEHIIGLARNQLVDRLLFVLSKAEDITAQLRAEHD